MSTDDPAIERIATGKYLELVRRGKWEFVRRCGGTDGVAILAITQTDEIILIREWRAAVAQYVLSLPAGLVGDEGHGEDPCDAAKRELLEETGFRAQRVEALMTGLPTPGLTNERISLVWAHGLERIHEGGGLSDEDITVERVPMATIHDWLQKQVQAGVEIDLKIPAALYYASLGRSTKQSR